MRLLLLVVMLLGAVRGAHATTASVGPDGNLVVDGQPFFPIGMYHVSYR